jgi:hypothetical protein
VQLDAEELRLRLGAAEADGDVEHTVEQQLQSRNVSLGQ